MPKRDRDAVTQGLSDILGGSDLLGSVIRSDRQRAGRTATPPPSQSDISPKVVETEDLPPARDVMTSQNVIGQYDNKTIRQDDNRAGVQADNTASGHAGKQAIPQADMLASGQPDNRANGQAGKQESVQADTQASSVAIGQADSEADRPSSATGRREGRRKLERGTSDLLEGRLAEAKRMAESGTTTVTLRLPRELNEWLDEYVHRAWPERVRKQELVIEGLRLLFARRGRPGEPILETNLLSE